ncbi:MAG: phosphatase PAP2 family protein [Gemmatimonadales bacterium]
MAVTARMDHRYRLVDGLTAGYGLIVAAVALSRVATIPGCWWIAFAHLLILPLVWLVRRDGLGRFGHFVAEVYPIVLIAGLYTALDVLQGPGLPPVHDALIQRLEQRLFGMQPSRDWWRAHPSLFWSTVLHGAYLCYYVIVPLPVLWFWFRGELTALRRVVLCEMSVFVFCYLWFVFFPVAGPYYEFARPTGAFVQTVTARMVYGALASGSSYGAAFPSSHVAATTAATLAAWAGDRRLGAAMALPAALLAIATVYCQMHYGIDAIAGLVVGIAIVALVVRSERWRVTSNG